MTDPLCSSFTRASFTCVVRTQTVGKRETPYIPSRKKTHQPNSIGGGGGVSWTCCISNGSQTQKYCRDPRRFRPCRNPVWFSSGLKAPFWLPLLPIVNYSQIYIQKTENQIHSQYKLCSFHLSQRNLFSADIIYCNTSS